MNITYGSRYTVRTNDYSSGAIITDSHNNKEILISELELMALNGIMHTMFVSAYGKTLDEDAIDRAIDYVLKLKDKNIPT